MVIVDTPIWSAALRRKVLTQEEAPIRAKLAQLTRDGQVRLMGVVRQELLSGIRERQQFARVRDYLRQFPDVPLETEDYEHAAEISNQLRSAGVAGSPVDVLLCAVAVSRGWQIFSTDKDFLNYAEIIELSLINQ